MIIYWIIWCCVVVVFDIGFDGPIGSAGTIVDMCAINKHRFFTLFLMRSSRLRSSSSWSSSSSSSRCYFTLAMKRRRDEKKMRIRTKRNLWLPNKFHIMSHLKFIALPTESFNIFQFQCKFKSERLNVDILSTLDWERRMEKQAAFFSTPKTQRDVESLRPKRERERWKKSNERINRTLFMLTVHSPRPKFAYLFPQQWISSITRIMIDMARQRACHRLNTLHKSQAFFYATLSSCVLAVDAKQNEEKKRTEHTK